MLIVNVNEALPGMVLAAPVAHPENPQHDLLKRGYALEESIIPRLRDLGVGSIYVEYPALDDLDRHLAPQLCSARQAIYTQMRDTIAQVQNRTYARVAFPDYYASTRDLVCTILQQGAHPIYLERVGGLGPDSIAHATTVAHLAVLLGLRTESYLVQQRNRLSPSHAREVVNVGVAGMLHDIGKMKLPEALRNRCELHVPKHDEPNDAGARQQWEEHPRLGYEMLHGGVECSAAAAVLHHHQHFDGSGFPAKVTKPTPTLQQNPMRVGVPEKTAPAPAVGGEIHVFARILLVADLYANLVRPPGTNMRRGNLEVLHIMRTRFGRWMDPVVFRALLAVAPPFLPGTKVLLGDQTSAAVVSVRPTDPYVPIVRRFKPNAVELDGPNLDLRAPGAPRLVALACGFPVAAYMPSRGPAPTARAA